MIRLTASLVLSALLTLAVAGPVAAQYPGGGDADDSSAGDPAAARLQVHISELEEQVRRLQGSIEQLSFQNRQLKAQMDKANGDMQYRLDALEKKQMGVPASAPVAEAPQPDSNQLHPVEAATDGGNDEVGSSEAPTPAPPPPKAQAIPQFASPREHYNYAYKLVNQAKYAEAGDAFTSFIKRYPRDPLVGNAYFWLGETSYVRRDYVKAADSFRLGYEAMPTGPKAGENLFKLATALSAMKKEKESCVVLKQVVAKFGSSSSSLRPRAEQEMNRIGCN